MKNIAIHQGDKVLRAQAPEGTRLLDVIQQSQRHIHALCGGKGTCRKCTVEVEGEGKVLACQYLVHKDISIKLSEKHAAKILELSETLEKKVMFDAGLASPAPGDNPVYGIAVDIGTTTIVIYLENLVDYSLVDVAAFLNPQHIYGQDVISRVNYTIENRQGLDILQKTIIDATNNSLMTLCARNNIDKIQIAKVIFVGNTIMLHLLLGIDPSPIAVAPFTPRFVDMQQRTGKEMNLYADPGAIVKTLSSLAGYVGADIIAGLAATPIPFSDKYSLYLDIGTNGEIALGNKDKIYCCATAAGPAFEGARIACGTGGVEGALSKFKNGKYETIGNEKIAGICGSGLIDVIAYLLDSNAIDETGHMENDFIIEKQAHTGTDHDIVLTPKDIRETQLAKAAIYAGILIMMKVAKISFEQIDTVYLAGGFGNYMDPDSAMRIGLIPRELGGKIKQIGNGAGTGARLALKSVEFEREIEKTVKQCEYIELSMRQDFNDEYVNGMMFI
ncbi:MAG: hypothetical protein A2268_01700 [Candidatus Raymondbacteria bacterium RifOxyA12_full_50_37]|uniref:2Fe-2S ferredoxin-type domain-containing protein n=1 Tax=Candidatus Raymondbacteria bacterium RIFOXYD12_FULL_49_13 TaxID=1817890 RepID=A0A1F7F9S5_UNCRA|nr:MAG: hypothetical protein A2268_01700 [Candidatus Raymondbacteria bacterium RifOxyA12_full_50_37]OGJ87780.1 MAG: hypothetical protein A2248_07305 [Candidatus Raymondbacteria bacterium RIFOXYA2_FULL_49_16]OGJ92487.1 MAG: hypothetical protein A2350_02965 [Candidatus Raymondbacteria bacterium RifOxyB12_full_50_8]OGJ95457.1 MAG: hypothetical protein A2487_15750 [Candidatus Raymondbacteria bacterium RifOxyC12_full_50_8]OGJ95658.1 MAG: hypothetical protein A2453_13300 [Candidatus Raymondbacteria b